MKNQLNVKKEIMGYAGMLIGCIMYALSTVLFLAPNTIVAGGVTGLSVMINYLNHNIPIGMISIVLNLPILILALRFCGFRFIAKCLLTISALGVATDLLVFLPSITADPLLSCLYGGVCQGIGIGLFVKYAFSSGGTELLGRLISQWTGGIKITLCVGILDGIVVLLGAVVTRNVNNMLYALIVIVVSTKISDVVLMGLEKSKCCIIVTDKGTEVSAALIQKSPRGVTMLQGEGMYTEREHNVLLTCVKSRQLTQLKSIVAQVDPNAFIIINESVEVRGKGFQSLNPK